MKAVTDTSFSLFLEGEGLWEWPLVAQDEPCQHQHVPVESLCARVCSFCGTTHAS